MRKLSSLTIKERILTGFALVIGIEIAAIIYFAVILTGVNQQVKGLIGIENLVEADRDAYQSHLELMSSMAGLRSASPETLKKASETILTNLNQINDRFNVFHATYKTKDIKLITLNANFSNLFGKLSEETKKMTGFIEEGKTDDLFLHYKSYLSSFDSLRDQIDQITNVTYENAINANKSVSVIIDNIALFVFFGLILLTALSIIVALLITRSVNSQVRKAVQELLTSSAQISSASNQLSQSSQDIANGAAEQASTMEETSASMEELASMVKQNALNAKEASVLADKTAEFSDSGYSQMEVLLNSMQAMNQGSSQIKKIIKVIDDIAFQTNILSLNAAVEAARAGEAGMGFAVVADEVKNLANRSAAAASETAEMIESSIEKTSSGLLMAEKMAQIFGDIRGNSRKLAEMSREVETASTQQDIGIEQVNKAVVQFDKVIQSNASASEQTASAAVELQTQVSSLNQQVEAMKRIISKSKNFGNEQNYDVYQQKRDTVHNVRENSPVRNEKKITAPEQLIPFEDDDDMKRM